MNYEGTVYRPPSEARSLIVQLTVGCAHNQCTFCTMYKEKRFRIRSVKEILKDFEEAASGDGSRVRRLFLADGDALVMKTEELLEVLKAAADYFPNLERISSYGTPGDLLRKTKEELITLRKAGLALIYMGAESGDDAVLEDVKKGVTREAIIAAGQKAKNCGLQISMTLISGLGGKERLREHALGCASLVNAVQPEYLGFLTLMLEEPAPILSSIRSGALTLLSPEDVVEEMQIFLEHVDAPGTVFRSNHASNYVMLKGTLNRDIPGMLRQLQEIKEQCAYRPEQFRAL